MKKREVLKYLLKNEQECILRFKITVFKPVNTRLRVLCERLQNL